MTSRLHLFLSEIPLSMRYEMKVLFNNFKYIYYSCSYFIGLFFKLTIRIIGWSYKLSAILGIWIISGKSLW